MTTLAVPQRCIVVLNSFVPFRRCGDSDCVLYRTIESPYYCAALRKKRLVFLKCTHMVRGVTMVLVTAQSYWLSNFLSDVLGSAQFWQAYCQIRITCGKCVVGMLILKEHKPRYTSLLLDVLRALF